VTFGCGPGAQVRAERVTADAAGRARFMLRTEDAAEAPVVLQLHGEHLVANALAAAAVALRYNNDVALVADALSAAAPVSAGRMQVSERPDGVTVINDAYNANPQSMAASLKTLAAMSADGRRAVAVLGEMAELGDAAPEAHRTVGDLAAVNGVAWLVVVGGANARLLAEAATTAGVAVELVPDRHTATRLVRDGLRPGDIVLVKASNSVGLLETAADLATVP
jgi:UDP-N-acetylmuramoyl-tripeptide--D-alanyl-D-alanine ligase